MTFWDFQASARRRTWGLLAAFALLVLGIAAGVHLVLALVFWTPALVAVALTSLRLEQVAVHYPGGFLATNIGIVSLMVLGGAWIKRSNLRQGGLHLAKQLGARAARPSVSHAEQQYLNIVDELCIAAGAQRPQAMVLPRDQSLNAFAAAWEAEDAVIVVSMGALDYLSRDELKGVVAHELSHLHEGDTRLNMELAGYVFGLEMLFNYGRDWVERGVSLFGRPLMAVGWLAGSLPKRSRPRCRASANTWPMPGRCSGRATPTGWAACCAKRCGCRTTHCKPMPCSPKAQALGPIHRWWRICCCWRSTASKKCMISGTWVACPGWPATPAWKRGLRASMARTKHGSRCRCRMRTSAG